MRGCGRARPVVVSHVWSRWERLRAWFVDGDRGGEDYECDNGHGWRSWTSQYYDWAHVPLRVRAASLWRSVASSRSAIPTPQSYTVAAAIGLIAGLAWGALFRWPWWLGPIGFVVASWVAATATAFRPSERAQTFAAVHASGASRRSRERLRRSIEELPFIIFGLVGRPEAPRFGGTSGDDGDITSLTITYGGASGPTASHIDIETAMPDPVGRRKYLEEEQLRHVAAGHPGLATYDPTMLSADIEWVDCEATVDGTTRTARQAALGDSWSVAIDDWIEY